MQLRDLKTQYQKYKTEIDAAIAEVLKNASFIGGKEISELEEQLADYVGIKHCISCANGTDAMTLVLMAWGIGKGDAVFIPDFTFFSTGEVAGLSGATPVFVDVSRSTFNLDPIKLKQAIYKVKEEGLLTPRVVIPVDLFGLPADYPQIQKIAKEHNLKVLEDAAQGFGASINNQKACSFGDAATTSFFPAKPLGCYGDGGAVFTGSDDLAGLIRSLKVHGKGSEKYDNVRIGLNSRLDTIQAAVLKVKLRAFIAHELEDVNKIYQQYNKFLQGLVEVPYIPPGFYSSFAQYTIKLKNREQRDQLQLNLKKQDIPSAIYYQKPLHRQAAFSAMANSDDDCKVSSELSDIALSLPMHSYLTAEEVEQVCRVIEATVS